MAMDTAMVTDTAMAIATATTAAMAMAKVTMLMKIMEVKFLVLLKSSLAKSSLEIYFI